MLESLGNAKGFGVWRHTVIITWTEDRLVAEVMLYGTSSPMLVRRIAVTLESWMDMCVIGKIIERCDLHNLLMSEGKIFLKNMYIYDIIN